MTRPHLEGASLARNPHPPDRLRLVLPSQLAATLSLGWHDTGRLTTLPSTGQLVHILERAQETS